MNLGIVPKITKTLFFNDKNNVSEFFYFLGIPHVFSPSGMHLSTLIDVSLFLFGKKRPKFSVFACCAYCVFIGPCPSIVRSMIYLFLKEKNKYNNCSCCDVSGNAVLVSLCFFPCWYNDLGFVYSSTFSMMFAFLSDQKIHRVITRVVVSNIAIVMLQIFIQINLTDSFCLFFYVHSVLVVPYVLFLSVVECLTKFFFCMFCDTSFVEKLIYNNFLQLIKTLVIFGGKHVFLPRLSRQLIIQTLSLFYVGFLSTKNKNKTI